MPISRTKYPLICFSDHVPVYFPTWLSISEYPSILSPCPPVQSTCSPSGAPLLPPDILPRNPVFQFFLPFHPEILQADLPQSDYEPKISLDEEPPLAHHPISTRFTPLKTPEPVSHPHTISISIPRCQYPSPTNPIGRTDCLLQSMLILDNIRRRRPHDPAFICQPMS